MFELFPPSSDLEAWVSRLVDASGWAEDERLLLWWGAVPYRKESGLTEWRGDLGNDLTSDKRWVHGAGEWDVIITLMEPATDLFDTHPGYVAWILGHELGHARVALDFPESHCLFLFIQDRIKSASGGVIDDWSQLPLERACDRFGRFVAEAALDPKKVREDLLELAELSSAPMGAERLRRTLSETPLQAIPDPMADLQALARLYLSGLEEAWDEEAGLGERSKVLGLDRSLLFCD